MQRAEALKIGCAEGERSGETCALCVVIFARSGGRDGRVGCDEHRPDARLWNKPTSNTGKSAAFKFQRAKTSGPGSFAAAKRDLRTVERNEETLLIFDQGVWPFQVGAQQFGGEMAKHPCLVYTLGDCSPYVWPFEVN